VNQKKKDVKTLFECYSRNRTQARLNLSNSNKSSEQDEHLQQPLSALFGAVLPEVTPQPCDRRPPPLIGVVKVLTLCQKHHPAKALLTIHPDDGTTSPS
jgi:hypothetical protein